MNGIVKLEREAHVNPPGLGTPPAHLRPRVCAVVSSITVTHFLGRQRATEDAFHLTPLQGKLPLNGRAGP